MQTLVGEGRESRFFLGIFAKSKGSPVRFLGRLLSISFRILGGVTKRVQGLGDE